MFSSVIISMQLPVLLVVIAEISSVFSISARMEPENQTIRQEGSNITIDCILTSPNDPQTSADIVWYHKSASRPIPSSQYEAISSTTSQLVLNHISFEDSGLYLCALASDGKDLMQYEGTNLYVGLPASSPAGLVCHSDNILDYWCDWHAGTDSNLKTQYALQYRQQMGGDPWKDCPDTESKGPNSCFISRNNNRGYTQKVRVTATNPLGSDSAEITFNPDLETIPNPPSNLSVESRGPHSLQVTWIMPAKWTTHFSMYLEYRLQYASEFAPDTWIEVSGRQMNGMRRRKPRYTMQNLEPYTRYNVRMSCKSMGVMDQHHWSEWTGVQIGMTDSSIPTAAVTAIDWREYSSHEEPLFKRDVFLQWKKLQREQQRGKITGYMINVMLQVDEGEFNVLSQNATSKVKFVLGLEKYSDYFIQISACNIAGCGPNATIFLPDGTSEPGAPKNVAAHWESLNSAKITWEMPSAPNGYVLAYTIQWAANNKDAEWSSTEVQANETSYLIKDLDQESTYQFRVQTENARGHSGWTYSYDLPDEETLALQNDQAISQSAQQILKQAAQSLKDMMALLRRTTKVDEDNASNEVLL